MRSEGAALRGREGDLRAQAVIGDEEELAVELLA